MTNMFYLFSTFCFVIGLKFLGRPATARKGNLFSSIGMLIAVVATLFSKDIVSFEMIAVGISVGSIIGFVAARVVAMTAMPQLVALFNGLGGLASLLIGIGIYLKTFQYTLLDAIIVCLAVTIGGVTFTGSLIAWAKLSGIISGKPITHILLKILYFLFILTTLIISVLFSIHWSADPNLFYILVTSACFLGILGVLFIGGADMPVVISLLNSCSGLAASATGFVVHNNLLIIAGALVGASGIILTKIMCQSMNRSLNNVLFMGILKKKSHAKTIEGETQPINIENTYYLLEAARNVLIVPGFGLAVSQAQHSVKELTQILEDNGAIVNFGIHPVAGRMPGHMNVLLAEANIDYDQLLEMDQVNSTMELTDVCIVIGANDVVNPSAREDKSGPIYGMPIINVDKAKTVIVLKRSMATGYAGIQNGLFYKDNTRMLFGDAKSSIQELINEFKSSA